MAIYPDISPNYGYSCVPTYRTDRLGPSDGDYTQFRAKRSTALYAVSLTYGSLTAADERTLMAFFDARLGGYGSFTFYDFVARVFPLETIAASADGVTYSYTLDYRDVSAEKVYFDGVLQADSIYTISNRTGTDGQDQLVFDSAPSATLAVTMSGTGKPRIPDCRFAADALSVAIRNWQRHQTGLISIIQSAG